MRCFLVILSLSLLCGCPERHPSQTSIPETKINKEAAELSRRHLVLEMLDRPAMRDAMPPARDMSFEAYLDLKAKYFGRNGSLRPGSALIYREREGDRWRNYWLTTESFNDAAVWLAELTQYKSRGWDWIGRYRLARSPEVDAEFKIRQIIEERARVLGGVKYGMTVDEVLAKKGRHYKLHRHAEGGSAYFVYDDVRISVRGGWRGGKGRVVRVVPTDEGMKQFVRNMPYEDEKQRHRPK